MRASRLVPLLLTLAGLALLAAPALPAAHGKAAKKTMTFKVRLIQQQTVRHHNDADGDNHANDTFSTTLNLYAMGSEFGKSDGQRAGTMAFDWGPLKGNCSTSGGGCDGTTNIHTVTKLPGGTITAGGDKVSLSKGIVVPVTAGTGIFKGATGSVQIAPGSVAVDVFHLTLPS